VRTGMKRGKAFTLTRNCPWVQARMELSVHMGDRLPIQIRWPARATGRLKQEGTGANGCALDFAVVRPCAGESPQSALVQRTCSSARSIVWTTSREIVRCAFQLGASHADIIELSLPTRASPMAQAPTLLPKSLPSWIARYNEGTTMHRTIILAFVPHDPT